MPLAEDGNLFDSLVASHPASREDGNTDAPVTPAIPAGAADALANGDQWTPFETRRQLDITNSPLQVEAVTSEDKKDPKDDKSEEGKEKEQRNAHSTDSDIEKMRLDFELTMLKRQHEENDKQRQHEEKMEHIRQQLPSRAGAHGEEEQLGGRLDPITEIELEKMRMEFELAKLRHISEENERQRQHERKTYEDKEKQRQHEEKMERVRQRQGNFRFVSQKGGVGEAVATEAVSGAFAELGKIRIELQLAMEIYLPEMDEKKHPSEGSGHQESPKLELQAGNKPEAEKTPIPLEQKNSGVTEHLGLQVPRIVVSGAEPEWSSSRMDLAIETELEKRRMEFELTRLKYEHDENERQRQHEEKMEQLRQKGAPPKEFGTENEEVTILGSTSQKMHLSRATAKRILKVQVRKKLLSEATDTEAHHREVRGWTNKTLPGVPSCSYYHSLTSAYSPMEDNPEYASSGADNATDQTSAPDDLTEPPCTPNEVTDPLDIRDDEAHGRTKPRVGLDNVHPSLANGEGEMAAWAHIELPNKKEACDTIAPQLKKMHLNMEITLTKYRYKAKEKEKQQRHEEKTGEVCQTAPLTQSPGGGHHLFLPRDQYTLFLYCFIFTHVIYIVRELLFFLIKEHELCVLGFILLCVVKIFWK